MIANFRRFKKRKKSSKNLFFPALISAALIFIAGFLIVSNFRLSQRRKELNIRWESFKKEIEKLNQEEQVLQSKIDQTKNPDFLEKIAREQFNLREQGEKVAVIVFPILEKLEEKGSEEEKNLWQKFLEKF